MVATGQCKGLVYKTLIFLLLLACTVAAHELINATCGVNELLLTSEEGVRRTGDFKLYQRVSNAVDFDGFLSGYGRAGDEHLFV